MHGRMDGVRRSMINKHLTEEDIKKQKILAEKNFFDMKIPNCNKEKSPKNSIITVIMILMLFINYK